MNKQQLIEFHEKFASLRNIRFIEKKHWGVFTTIMKGILNRYLKKYISNVPNMEINDCPKTLKKLVVLNYNIGCGDVSWVSQVKIAAHEAEHALQIQEHKQKGGSVSNWYSEYFRDSEFRATMEGGACITQGEVYYFLTGRMPFPPSLDSYYVGLEGQRISDQVYSIRSERIKKMGRGSSTSVVSRDAIKILKDMNVVNS